MKIFLNAHLVYSKSTAEQMTMHQSITRILKIVLDLGDDCIKLMVSYIRIECSYTQSIIIHSSSNSAQANTQ